MRFEFATATRILFGRGTLKELAPLAKSLGRRVLVVTGRTASRADGLNQLLSAHGLERCVKTIDGEPTIADAQEGAGLARAEGIDLIIGFGGGSAIDAAKAIAALATNEGDALDYVEVIGRGQPLTRSPLPIIAVPTTAGTGAEVTRNAVLASPEHRVKASLRSPLMLAKLAVVDPDLTLDLPQKITVTSGLDALTQLIEPFVCVRANPFTDAFCREGMTRAARSLRQACEQPGDADAREDMALASLFSGLALANAGLGAVHGFAAPIGGMFSAPHGAVCAALLPHTVEVNLRALRKRQPASVSLERFDEIARILTGQRTAQADDGVKWLRDLTSALKVLPLGVYGVRESDFQILSEKASSANSMKGNPIELTAEERIEILRRAS